VDDEKRKLGNPELAITTQVVERIALSAHGGWKKGVVGAGKYCDLLCDRGRTSRGRRGGLSRELLPARSPGLTAKGEKSKGSLNNNTDYEKGGK